MNDYSKKFDRISYLKKAIPEMDYFITTIDVTERGKEYVNLSVVTVKQTTVEVGLFGTRDYVIGNHRQFIPVPKGLLSEFVKWAKAKKTDMQVEFNELLKD